METVNDFRLGSSRQPVSHLAIEEPERRKIAEPAGNQPSYVAVLFKIRTRQQDVQCLRADVRQLNSHIRLLQTDFPTTP